MGVEGAGPGNPDQTIGCFFRQSPFREMRSGVSQNRPSNICEVFYFHRVVSRPVRATDLSNPEHQDCNTPEPQNFRTSDLQHPRASAIQISALQHFRHSVLQTSRHPGLQTFRPPGCQGFTKPELQTMVPPGYFRARSLGPRPPHENSRS